MPSVYRRRGSPFYQFRYPTADGYRRLSTGKRNRAEAQKFADAYAESQKPVEGYLFSKAHDLYIKSYPLKPKTIRGYDSSHRMIKATLNDFYLNTLKVSDIETYIKARLTVCSPARIKRDLAYLSSLYNWAMTLDEGPHANPMEFLNKRRFKLKEAQERTRWLTENQFEYLLSLTTNPIHRTMLIVAVETGMRRDELLQLRRDEVELDQRRIVIGNLSSDRTKTGEGRIIPLTDRACDTLRSTLALHSSIFVFVNPGTKRPVRAIHGWWYPLIKRAGFDGLRFHDLRHTFASWCAQRGIDERTVQAWLGQKTRSMTHRYQHLREIELHTAARKFSGSTRNGTNDGD